MKINKVYAVALTLLLAMIVAACVPLEPPAMTKLLYDQDAPHSIARFDIGGASVLVVVGTKHGEFSVPVALCQEQDCRHVGHAEKMIPIGDDRQTGFDVLALAHNGQVYLVGAPRPDVWTDVLQEKAKSQAMPEIFYNGKAAKVDTASGAFLVPVAAGDLAVGRLEMQLGTTWYATWRGVEIPGGIYAQE